LFYLEFIIVHTQNFIAIQFVYKKCLGMVAQFNCTEPVGHIRARPVWNRQIKSVVRRRVITSFGRTLKWTLF